MRKVVSLFFAVVLLAMTVVPAKAAPMAQSTCPYNFTVKVKNANGTLHTGWVHYWIDGQFQGLQFIYEGWPYMRNEWTGTMTPPAEVEFGLYDDTDTAVLPCQAPPYLLTEILTINLPY